MLSKLPSILTTDSISHQAVIFFRLEWNVTNRAQSAASAQLSQRDFFGNTTQVCSKIALAGHKKLKRGPMQDEVSS